jgi:putative two-component system response regulator
MTEEEKQKVLIVDDSLLNRSILIDMLGEEYEVYEAENGEVALKIITEHGKDLSLILLDLVMPKMNGFEVLEEMNRCKWMIDTIPVIVISTEKDNRSLNRAFDLGALDFIERPYNYYNVQRRVGNALATRRIARRTQRLVEQELLRDARRSTLFLILLTRTQVFQKKPVHFETTYVVTREILMELRKMSGCNCNLTEDEIEDAAAAAVLYPGMEAGLMNDLSVAGEDRIVKLTKDIQQFRSGKEFGKNAENSLSKEKMELIDQAATLAEVCDQLMSGNGGGEKLTFRDAVNKALKYYDEIFDPKILTPLRNIAGKLSVMADSGTVSEHMENYVKSIAEERYRKVFGN